MPSGINGLTGPVLKMPANVINLVIPIGTVLNRFSMIMIYIAASVFAAELYGLTLNISQILLVVFLSVLAAIAGAGAPGLVSISMVSIVLLPLGLPAQAIIILLIAIYPIIDPITTVASVQTNLAIGVVIAGSLEKETELKST
jgi:proton glutamate symport protein